MRMIDFSEVLPAEHTFLPYQYFLVFKVNP